MLSSCPPFSRLHSLRWLLSALAACCGATHAVTLYVSTEGQAGNDGLQRTQQGAGKGPVPSLSEALATLRQNKEARSGKATDRIIVLPGRYTLAQTLTLTPQDSGADKAFPLVIEADKPGSVTLSGGRHVGGFRQVEGKPYASVKTDLPRGFHMLWINGDRATRARSPAVGQYFIGGRPVAKPKEGDRFFRPQDPNNIENTRRLVLPDKAQQELRRAAKAGPLDGLVLQAMHSWNSSAHRVTAFDAETGIASVTPDSFWSFFKFGPDQRFALENLPAFLDEPGEWWASGSGDILYIPRSGESIDQLQADVPQVERLIDLSGQPGKPIQHIQFKGIRFMHSAAWTVPFVDSQAALAAPAAVVMTHARDIVIERCAFEHIGGYGVWMRQGSRANIIRQTRMRDLGAGGIRIGEASMSGSGDDTVELNRIEDNLIEDGGRAFPGAVGIWVGQSGSNTLEHNEIRRMSYTGISLGWTWGFGGSRARDNIVQYNYLHDLGQGMLSDLGAIYTLGISDGTRIRFNRIEDITSFKKEGSTGWGIYLDEGSSHILVENNLVKRTTGGGLHLHYGNDNVVRNNVFADSQAAQARRSRKQDTRLVFENNLLIANGAPLFYGEWDDDQIVSKGNVLVTRTPKNLYRNRDLQGMQAEGREEGSVVATDKNVSCGKQACSLDKATAGKSGFKPFSVEGAGLSADAALLP